jgi:hypothetical protein
VATISVVASLLVRSCCLNVDNRCATAGGRLLRSYCVVGVDADEGVGAGVGEGAGTLLDD